jgi:hypothetical protein
MNQKKAGSAPNDRKLLVIAFHYPPDNTSTGGLRTFKFTEYLLRHGWRSHVISVPTNLYRSLDPAGAARMPKEVTVERVWARDAKSVFGFRGVYPSWLGIPDRYWTWLFSGTRAGARAIRGSGIDVVYSTYPMPSAHLIGLRLKRRFGLPWIADFRDPWAVSSGAWPRDWVESRLERLVVAAADRVICNTPAMRRRFLKTYPDVDASHFVTITNGYDEPEFGALQPARSDKFHILYPGTVDRENRNPRPVLAAVAAAIKGGQLPANDVLLTFLGSGNYGVSTEFRADLDRYGLRSITEVVAARIPRREALNRIAGADVLVVLSDQEQQTGDAREDWTSMQVPAKVYEYLRLGSPMLPLVQGGAVAEVLREVQGCEPLSPRDVDRVAKRLGELYRGRRDSRIPPHAPPAVARYSRENLTVKLAAELAALVVS